MKPASAFFLAALTGVCLSCPLLGGQTEPVANRVDLPSSKQLLLPVPGEPQKLNSLPMVMAKSPDGHYIAVINAGYGTYDSHYMQSIAVIDTQTGKVADFPDSRTPARFAPQTLYAGLAFSRDGKHLYASLDSLTDPTGRGKDSTGNAIAVYSFADGVVAPERLIRVPLQKLAPGKSQARWKTTIPAGMAIPAPAGLAVVAGPSDEDRILVADNLSDDVLLMDAGSGKILYRYDLSDSPTVPAAYPISVLATKDGRRAFAALWNGSAIAELDLRKGTVLQTLPLLKPRSQTSSSSHPTALVLSPDEKLLYVALANRDMVAAVEVGSSHEMRLKGLFDTRLTGQSYFGAVPNALVLSENGRRLYVANASSDSVAVFDTKALTGKAAANGPVEALGFVPTEWYPTGVALEGKYLYVATAKGQGTGPNNFPQKPAPTMDPRFAHGSTTYIAKLLYGSVARMATADIEQQLPKLTEEARASNLLEAQQKQIAFHDRRNPIKHVIYIIKENRTYDQDFGDIKEANGDPSLTMYGESVTPNQHKLARQFGVLDNFFDSGEVSGDGHVWSNAAITSDYTEKTWQQVYRGGERMYAYEGVVAKGYPLLEGIPDVNEPASGYLWTNMAKHHKTYYHFGEYVSTKFCGESGEQSAAISPLEGTPEPGPAPCAHPAIRKGDPIPANYGGGVSQYPWPIPLINKDIATKAELQGHFDPQYPDFNLSFPDQLRFEEFHTQFKRWLKDRENGRDTMPEFINLRLPNDHTAGTRPGSPTPKASVADNDLAVGRAVDLISHSPYWADTAFFILEDDAQAGADHVDAHRSIALVVSKYAPRPQNGMPFVDHSFYTTVSVIRTMESLLGLPPMNQNDALAPLIGSEFAGDGTQPAFEADFRNRDNGLIFTANTPRSPGARESSKMDFRHADQADTQKLNAILWRDAMGDRPMPASLKRKAPQRHDEDDQ